MNTRFAISSTVIGFTFLAASVFNYFDSRQSVKIFPSIAQEIGSAFGLLWLHIALFLIVFTFVHGVTGWLFAFLTYPPARKLTGNKKESTRLVLLLFLIAVLWIALESAARFPHSLLGSTFYAFATSSAGIWIRIAAVLLLTGTLVVGTGMRIVEWSPVIRRKPALHTALGAVMITGLAGWIGFTSPDARPFPNDPDRPHVILVGIDGWRLDTLPANGGMPGLMPFVEEFMAESAVIEEAITPLARTFPAWWTVFTGQFPPTHGARFNLIDEQYIRTPLTLPQQLGERGYYRLFAIDERRFANFREAHGFDRVAGPGIGAADFLLGNLNDSPLTNLLANTFIGRYFFPFTHANRAAYITYRPQTFDALLERAIAGVPRQPLFLTVHYELPHWPFHWADGPTGEFAPHPLGSDYADYMETLSLVDRQVTRLFGQLEALGILENAIVVLLSDHGEAFSEERLSWSTADSGQKLTTPAGHGTHVLGMTQHQVPLAFRRFGNSEIPAGMRSGRASLADIYPTLVEWLDLEVSEVPSGQSLVPALEANNAQVAVHPIPVETGFYSRALMENNMSESRLFLESAAYYEITRDGRLEVKDKYFEELISGKQRAVLYGDHIMTHIGNHGVPKLWHIESRSLQERAAGSTASEAGNRILLEFCRLFQEDKKYLNNALCQTQGEGK